MQNQHSRICFIVNPAANDYRSLTHIDWLRIEASKRWKHYEIVIADKQQSLADLAKSKARFADIIVACGGDGTVSQIINGLAKAKTLFGVLPIGSGNDFVKSMGLNKSLPECLEIIYKNKSTFIDLIRYEGDAEGWCANTLGLGIDGWANFYAQQTEWLNGRIQYYFGAMKAILAFRGCKMKLSYNNHTKEDNLKMITICNGKWEGGNFFVAPHANMKDGLLNILTIRKVLIPTLIFYLLWFRRGPAEWMNGMSQYKTKTVEISTSTPVAAHRDGEHLGCNIQHLKLTVEQNALRIITSNDY